jgi:hypothetical protein
LDPVFPLLLLTLLLPYPFPLLAHTHPTTAHQPALQQIAIDAKIIPQLLTALETDTPIYQGDLPTLVAVLGLLRDQENMIPGISPRKCQCLYCQCYCFLVQN